MAKERLLCREKNSWRRTVYALLLAVVCVGCAELKKQVYEGFDRDTWQVPDKVIQTLGIRSGNHIADLGSGSGYFTFRLARAAGPEGKVYAVDVDQSMNDMVARSAREEKLENIETILARINDPLIPQSGVDLIFSSNSYHHLEDRINYFINAKKYLRPGGRVAIIDFREGMFSHFTPGEVIRKEMKAAGYFLLNEYEFLPKQHFLVFSSQPQ